MGLMVLCATQLECECHCWRQTPQRWGCRQHAVGCSSPVGATPACARLRWEERFARFTEWTQVRAPLSSPSSYAAQLAGECLGFSPFPRSWFSLPALSGLCLCWMQLRAHLRGEGAGQTRRTLRSQHECSFSLLPSFRRGLRSQGGEDRGAEMAKGPHFALCVCLVLAVDYGEGQEGKPFGETCLEDFRAGMPDLVLDTDASVQNGATFLSSPMVRRRKDCVRACCREPACNLALVEQDLGTEEDHIRGCFLLNCLYEQAFVCRFARKIGFLNFLRKDVYDSYLAMQDHRSNDDRPPIARTAKDMRVQPGEPVMLRGIESTDDRGIVSYEWKQVVGDPSVEMKKHKDDQVEISNLQAGVYVFQLTVTDTAQQQDFTNITIMVLNSEQTEEHCLTPKKVGWCRGAFPRWFYNPSLQQCEEFIFGGCKPNKNNYLREEECQLACKNVRGAVGGRQQPVCNGKCQPPFFKCKDGCCIDAYLECDETLDCADGSDEMYCERYAHEFNRLQKINVTHQQGHCVELPDTGQCTESIPRWYYNPFSEKCDPFTYGGCGGNSNNFEKEDECMKSCSGITKADVIGRRWESFEPQSSLLSAFEVVIAVLLGICIMVVLAIIGYFFLKKRKNSHRHQPSTATNSTLSTTEDTERLFYSSATKPV